MSAIRHDLPPAPVGQGAIAGYFSRNVDELLDEAFVILPTFDRNLEWGPCYWQSRDDFSLPGEGDPCLVIFDNDRRPWVVAWVPQ